jgi:glycosyltransferase involved in cell wall biosynthesis
MQVNRLRPDIVFTPMQTMGSWGREYKLVLTVHDLIYYSNRTPPRDLPAPIRLLWRLYHLAWWPQRMLLNRADAIVTVSKTTARLIAEHHLTKRPVSVVMNAADQPTPAQSSYAAARATPTRSAQSSYAAARATPTRRSLVYMGSFMPYKNVETLVRAAALLPGCTLHLMSRISDAERQRLSAVAPGATLVFHNGATDEQYQEELAGATALVTASRDEGFGIPLVEAMTLGTPAVVSDIPIFREIGADACVYFDPESPEALASAIRSLEAPAVWLEHSRRAVERARQFTWAASAEHLLTVLTATVGRADRVRRRLR